MSPTANTGNPVGTVVLTGYQVKPDAAESEFVRFEQFARKIVAVPKEEIDAIRKAT